MKTLKWQQAGWRERFPPRRNTHSGQLQAGGRSLGKVTNRHTPPLQCCQQSLISLCLHKRPLSGPERKVVTSPVVLWIASVPRAAPSAANAEIQQLWFFYSENVVLFKRTSPEEWQMSVRRIRDVDEWTELPYLNLISLPLCFYLRIRLWKFAVEIPVCPHWGSSLFCFVEKWS